MKKVLEKGSSVLSEGVSAAKHGAISATQGIVQMAETVGEKSKEVQMNVLTYIDQKKNARFLKAKLSAFEDGLKAGKMQTVDYIKISYFTDVVHSYILRKENNEWKIFVE